MTDALDRLKDNLWSTTIPIRVRYQECDPMNVAHHSAYAVWFEIARTELLREQGAAYAQCEKDGVFFVVARLSTRFRKPAHYDDELAVEVTAEPSVGVKIEHRYRVLRGKDLLATGETTLACVNADGKLQAVPESLRI